LLVSKISKYVDWLPLWSEQITVEHVMTHTSGLPSLNWFVGIETEDVNKQIRDVKELAFEPGTGFLYTNMNIVIRGYLIEAITKQPYQEFMSSVVLDKASMNDTLQPIGMKNLSNRITYHEDLNALKTIVSYSTPLDLYKFEKALWEDKIIESNTIIEFLFGDHLSESSNRAYFDFGRFYLNKENQLDYWEHDGSSWPSHHALKYHHFGKDIIITLMSNDGNKNTLFEIKTSLLILLDSGETVIPASWWFKKEYATRGFLHAFENLQKRSNVPQGLGFSESDTNALGYWLLQQKKYLEAKKVLKLNLDNFPSSANSYDSYADVLVKLKYYAQATSYIKIGLSLARKEKNIKLETYLQQQLKQIDKLVK